MEKKYVVKDLFSNNYYCGSYFKFCPDKWLVEYFDTLDMAENFISSLPSGTYCIEPVYKK